MDIGYELLKVFVVVVYGLKELEKAFNDLHVGLTESFVKLDCLNTRLDSLVKLVLILEIIEVKQNAFVFLELCKNKRCSTLIDHLSIDCLLDNVGLNSCCCGVLVFLIHQGRRVEEEDFRNVV